MQSPSPGKSSCRDQICTATQLAVVSQTVKEAMQRIHDRGNIGKLILDVEKTPTPLVSEKQEETVQFHMRDAPRVNQDYSKWIRGQGWGGAGKDPESPVHLLYTLQTYDQELRTEKKSEAQLLQADVNEQN
ncbi:hypothetical protein P7K49_036784 [Saguinus oedipus]|uniref:Uncharacterized protein n=1 Tax=Saguinus oedipus TaxID=9490 RepID=A0ABQ9TL42_SAGOE|nr:hypothetical protein P7K49_036784 [Saguinus oedipus]